MQGSKAQDKFYQPLSILYGLLIFFLIRFVIWHVLPIKMPVLIFNQWEEFFLRILPFLAVVFFMKQDPISEIKQNLTYLTVPDLIKVWSAFVSLPILESFYQRSSFTVLLIIGVFTATCFYSTISFIFNNSITSSKTLSLLLLIFFSQIIPTLVCLVLFLLFTVSQSSSMPVSSMFAYIFYLFPPAINGVIGFITWCYFFPKSGIP